MHHKEKYIQQISIPIHPDDKHLQHKESYVQQNYTQKDPKNIYMQQYYPRFDFFGAQVRHHEPYTRQIGAHTRQN